jgi:hypothetical protein
MQMNRTIYAVIAVAGLLCAPAVTFAQSAPPAPPNVPLQKQIGETHPDLVPSLIVMNSRGATLQGGKLMLTDVSPNSIVFADRPVRAAGHVLTAHLIEEWAGNGTFASDPPNATVSGFSKDGSKIRDAVVVLKSPKLEGDRLTFDVDVLEGDLTGADGAASIFIDRFGFGFRGVGAGVGRFGYARAGFVRRGAFYRGAAIGAAAVGAAAAGAYYGATCGYYPYPPCY